MNKSCPNNAGGAHDFAVLDSGKSGLAVIFCRYCGEARYISPEPEKPAASEKGKQ